MNKLSKFDIFMLGLVGGIVGSVLHNILSAVVRFYFFGN